MILYTFLVQDFQRRYQEESTHGGISRIKGYTIADMLTESLKVRTISLVHVSIEMRK